MAKFDVQVIETTRERVTMVVEADSEAEAREKIEGYDFDNSVRVHGSEELIDVTYEIDRGQS